MLISLCDFHLLVKLIIQKWTCRFFIRISLLFLRNLTRLWLTTTFSKPSNQILIKTLNWMDYSNRSDKTYKLLIGDLALKLQKVIKDNKDTWNWYQYYNQNYRLNCFMYSHPQHCHSHQLMLSSITRTSPLVTHSVKTRAKSFDHKG